MTQMGEIGSEFSAPRIPFEEFVKRPAWQARPFLIQLALLHLPKTEIDRPPSGPPVRPSSVGEYHPA